MSCIIVIPTYNRKQFEKLIEYNINCQTYNNIKQVLIIDDGDDEKLELKIPYNVRYVKLKYKITIGQKRNLLNTLALEQKPDYIVCMDTDDIYNENYITKSIFNLIKYNKQVSGSSDMIMYLNKKTYLQQCIYLDLFNEATLVFTKEYAQNHKFKEDNSSEGKAFLINNYDGVNINNKILHETDINDIMVCVVHSNNSVCKIAWCEDKYKHDIKIENKYKHHLEILSQLNI